MSTVNCTYSVAGDPCTCIPLDPSQAIRTEITSKPFGDNSSHPLSNPSIPLSNPYIPSFTPSIPLSNHSIPSSNPSISLSNPSISSSTPPILPSTTHPLFPSCFPAPQPSSLTNSSSYLVPSLKPDPTRSLNPEFISPPSTPNLNSPPEPEISICVSNIDVQVKRDQREIQPLPSLEKNKSEPECSNPEDKYEPEKSISENQEVPQILKLKNKSEPQPSHPDKEIEPGSLNPEKKDQHEITNQEKKEEPTNLNENKNNQNTTENQEPLVATSRLRFEVEVEPVGRNESGLSRSVSWGVVSKVEDDLLHDESDLKIFTVSKPMIYNVS